MENRRQIDISMQLIFKATATVLALWFLYMIRDVIAIFFLSVILTATLDPLIDWLARKKIGRPLGVMIIYIVMFSLIGVVLSFLIPPLVGQIQDFTQNIPKYSQSATQLFSGIEQYAKSYGLSFNSHEFIQNALGNIFQSSGQVFSTTMSVVAFLISMLVILALTFYMSVKEDSMSRFLVSIAPDTYHDRIVFISNKIKEKIGRWFAGQIMLMFSIFMLDFIALSVFRIPYALVLALLAGILEIVPYMGPIISATLASMVGFLISPLTGFLTLAILTVIQQIESHIIVPQVMKKAVGLNPVAVILALLIGAKLGGTLGAVLSIPVATTISVLASDIFNKKESAQE